MRNTQMRMARAALNIPLHRVAKDTGYHVTTLHRYEMTGNARYAWVMAVRKYFEAAGVEFVDDSGDRPGIRVREMA